MRRLGVQPNDTREFDHIIPLSQGGDNHFTNLRLLPKAEHMRRPKKATPEEVAAVALLRLYYPNVVSFRMTSRTGSG